MSEAAISPTVLPSTGLSPYRPWLHRFCWLLVIATFTLVALGGTVTSRGAGLSVPDWPNSYGYNMFLFPPSLWRGGIFWEHTHRLKGSVVGLLTIVLAVWLWRSQPQRPWLRWMGLATLLLVIVQGVMGGLRVTELDHRLGILHGVTGQVFFTVVVLIMLATGPLWCRWTNRTPADQPTWDVWRRLTPAGSRGLALALMVVLLIQLGLGAALRHEGAGLAIPDFPTSYGRWLPPMSQAALDDALATMPYEQVTGDYSVQQVHLHFGHRVWAAVVVIMVMALLARLGPAVGAVAPLRAPAIALVVLLALQVLLGASVIWTGRHPEIATAHQSLGAILLAVALTLCVRLHLVTVEPSRRPDPARAGDLSPRTQS